MSTSQFLTSAWTWSPPVVLAGLAVLGTYAAVARIRLSKRGWVFAVAVAVFLVTLVSPIEMLAEHYLFSAHMFQHMTLLLIVPLLALLARRGSIADLPRRGNAQQSAAAAWPGALTFPLVAWVAGVGAMWFWHAPALCDAATSSPGVRAVQVVSLLLLGGLFWWPIVGNRARQLPPLAGVVYLFSACLGCTLLGIIITFSPIAVCSMYIHPMDPLGVLPLIRQQWGLTTTVDQQVGGLMMWVPSCFVYLVAILTLLLHWYAAPDSHAEAPPTTQPHPSPSHS